MITRRYENTKYQSEIAFISPSGMGGMSNVITVQGGCKLTSAISLATRRCLRLLLLQHHESMKTTTKY